jgi:DNA-binding MarR family transcriptional regulator
LAGRAELLERGQQPEVVAARANINLAERPGRISPEETMPDYPALSTQVIGQAERALGALLDPLLTRTGITFGQWLVLTITAQSGTRIDRAELVARISAAWKIDSATIESAIAELTAAGLVATTDGPVALTGNGRSTYYQIRGGIEEITARLFDFAAEELETAGRVLTIVTARANALLTDEHAPTAAA